MAKYRRHDPRNKKNNRNKIRSITKDLRIHMQETPSKEHYHDVEWAWYDDEIWEDEGYQ